MRFAYVDEAGTASNEPVTVVAGIVVEADVQRSAAERSMTALLESVPERFREEFRFHATDIWNNKKYRDDWAFGARKQFLCDVMSVPRRLKVPVVLGKVRRNALLVDPARLPVRTEQFDHIVAFGTCIEQADDFVRRFGSPGEGLTVIAEDVPELRSWLRKAITGARQSGGRMVPPDDQEPTREQRTAGVKPEPKFIGISRMVDVVHFVEKRDAPLLQLADALAFGFRRYLANQSEGEGFARAIVGTDLVMEDWAGGVSQFTFHRETAR